MSDNPKRYDALTAADSVDPVRMVEAEEGERLLSAIADQSIVNDVLAKVDAGAGLAYAIYHGGIEFVTAMPETVMIAYMRACEAYQIGRHGRSRE